jgi:hypothetical protein
MEAVAPFEKVVAVLRRISNAGFAYASTGFVQRRLFNNRRFSRTVVRIARTGAAGVDLARRLGKGNSRWQRFDRWAARDCLVPSLPERRDPDLDRLFLDSTAERTTQASSVG